MEPPKSIAAIVERLRQLADDEALSYDARLLVVSDIRRAIVPRRKPGKKDRRIDEAYTDYKAGMRGLALLRKHNPHRDKMSRWRRKAEDNKLMKSLQKRAERERKAPGGDRCAQGVGAPTIPAAVSSPPN